jgi:hypothetical protein
MLIPVWIVFLICSGVVTVYLGAGYFIDLLANSEMKSVWRVFWILFWPIGVLVFFLKWLWEIGYNRYLVRQKIQKGFHGKI